MCHSKNFFPKFSNHPFLDREIELKDLETSAKRTSILLYDNGIVGNATQIKEEVKALCQCDVEHLPAIEIFVLRYHETAHLPAEEFLAIKGIVLVDEDHVIMPPDDLFGNDNFTSTIVRRTAVMNTTININNMIFSG